MTGYPENAQLCHDASFANVLRESDWCDAEQLDPSQLPCRCLGFFDRLVPNWRVFWTALFIICGTGFTICFIFWYHYIPAWAEFGYPGMGTIHGGMVRHPAQFYVKAEGGARENLALSILERKLGRAPSDRVIKQWHFAPVVRRLLSGYHEELTMKEDTIELRTRGGVPPCCICFRRAAADIDEYYTLLQDINFIEVGAELHPVIHALALVFFVISVGIFMASYAGPIWADGGPFERHIVCNVKTCTVEDSSDACPDCYNPTASNISHIKWSIVIIGFVLYLFFEFLAGKKKRGFIVINIPLGGTQRGVGSNYMGATPFFIRLLPNHPDTDATRYKHFVRLVRAAVTASRGNKGGGSRAIDRFRKAVIKVKVMNLLGGSLAAIREEKAKQVAAEEAARDVGQSHKRASKRGKLQKQKHLTEANVDEAQQLSVGRLQALRGVFKSIGHGLASGFANSSLDQKMDDEGTAADKIFAEIDKDGSNSINLYEFTEWLDDWIKKVGAADKAVLDGGEKLKEGCKQKFMEFDVDGDNDLSPSEFNNLMDNGGLVEALKEGQLFDAMAFSNMFDVQAIHNVFDKFDEDHSGSMVSLVSHAYLTRISLVSHDVSHGLSICCCCPCCGSHGLSIQDVNELLMAFQDLNLHPNAQEVDMLLARYDDDKSGELDKAEFTKLMLDYIKNNEAKTSYNQRAWCPLRMFQIDLDFLPWGQTTTELLKDEFTSRGNEGLFGRNALCSTSYFTFETAKTRWLHVEGNPMPLWKLNVYLGEALLVYTLVVNHEYFQDYQNSPYVYEHRMAIARMTGVVWWVFRSFSYFIRKRGQATAYSWGKPPEKRGKKPKGSFPVPIHEIEELVQKFLEVKGVSPKEPAAVFRTKIPGYGIIPLWFASFRGMHTLHIGDRHFKVDKVSGGGGGRMQRRFTRIDQMAGFLEDVKWISVTKYGKVFHHFQFCALFSLRCVSHKGSLQFSVADAAADRFPEVRAHRGVHCVPGHRHLGQVHLPRGSRPLPV
jgi:Ca2+-binding EF-hand superfamily protein